MKVSTKSALLSTLTIATMLSSSLAMAQLTPGRIDDENRRQQQPQQQGLTPGQINAENNQQALDEARERERLERARQAERQAREDREEAAHQAALREAFRLARIAAEREAARQEAIRMQQEADRIAAQQEAIRIQQQIEAQRLADEAARLAAEARKGSAKVAFTNVTRKAGGETLVVTLAQPMMLENIELSVLSAAAKYHNVIVRTDNGHAYMLTGAGNIAAEQTLTASDMPQVGQLAGLSERVQAIEVTVESMGAKSIINIEVNSLEGKPSLKAIRPGKVIR